MRKLAVVTLPYDFFCNPKTGSCQNAVNIFGVGPGSQYTTANIGQVISTLLPNLFVLAGIIFFGLIVAGGWGYLIGAGGEPSAQDKAKAKAALTYGVIGFLLVISAYFILQIVETVTGVKFIKPNI